MATLSAGTRLGPYEVAGLIGAGGMGEVYRARDTRLDRTVALKVLPHDLAADPERRSRFEREARTISTLNHPHICTLHDVGEADGQAFLVMEHLVGETLAERLKKGPLPLAQALTVAMEIADALAAAHRQGVIHRDLKPGNVMLTKSGAKLLDFGLAKLAEHGERAAVGAEMSAPTRSDPVTERGTILGTLQYMAPEQLEGKPADARTDLWALGAILYEMLTGKRAFAGGSTVSLMGAILEREPVPIATVQPLTPAALERLVSRCLAKAADDRWDTAHDVADELRWIAQISPNAPAGSGGRRALFGIVVAALAGAAIAGAAMLLWQRSPAQSPRLSARLTITLPADAPLAPGGLMPLASDRPAVALSPDGSHLAYVAARGGSTHIFVRNMTTGQVTPVPDTEGAHTPFFSPNGASIAFFRDGKLRTIALTGGSATTLADAPNPWGGAWIGDVICFNRFEGEGLFQVKADGGPVLPLVMLRSQGRSRAGALMLLMPEPLGNGDGFLATESSRTVWVQKGETSKDILTGFGARYVATGHLVYAVHGKLMAVPFDPVRLALTGQSVVLADDLRTGILGTAQFTVSSDGTLVYVPGVAQQRMSFVWVDRLGKRRFVRVPEAVHGAFDLSPDGRWLAASMIGDDNVGDIWVYDLTGAATATRLVPRTTVGEPASRSGPRWTPDSKSIAFTEIGAEPRIVLAPVDGSGPVTVWSSGKEGTTPSMLSPHAFSRDGSMLLAFGSSPHTSFDLWSIRLAAGESGRSKGGSPPEVLLERPLPRCSPPFRPMEAG